MVEAAPTASPASERAREAAATEARRLIENEVACYHEKFPDGILAGTWDNHPFVQAFVAFERRILADQASVEQIDAAAKYLRETHGTGKRLTPWDRTPKATKKKWLILAEGMLRAALSPAPSAQGAPLTPTEQHDERP